MEAACEKMLKDSVVFRDSVSGELSNRTGWHLAYRTGLLYSGSSFSGSLATLFSPLGAEYNLAAKHPNSEITLKNITQYQSLMEEMRGGPAGHSRRVWADSADTLSPELELIDSRIVQPSKDLNEICKKIRKTCTKRDHKLIDYDRHNNSLNKLREKKEKSLSDEKNLFKVTDCLGRYSTWC